MPRKRKSAIDLDHKYTTAEAAELVGLEARSVKEYCRLGRFPGAEKRGRDWFVPGADLIAYQDHIADPERPQVGRPRNLEG